KVLNHQEAIFELSYTEHEYVTDLCTIRDHMMKPLHNSDLLPAQNRNRFIASVFKNLLALLATNSEFDVDLQRRQKESMIVDRVGDVVLRHVENFECYIEYGANKIFSKHFLEQEQQRNPRFLQFLEEFARMPEVRKLNIESFLFKPCQRIMHYPLLLHKVLKHTPEGHPDRELIPKAVDKINDICSRMNIETGVASNRLNLMKISELLECKPSEKTDLDLDNDARQLIKSGKMKKRSGVETAEIMVFLFDHMLMMCRIKRGRGNEVSEYRLYKRLIPLQMLAVSSPDGLGSTRVRTNVRRNSFSDLGSASQSMATLVASPTGTAVAPSSTSVSASNTLSVAPLAAGIADGKLGAAPAAPAELDIPGGTGKYVYPITFTHLSRNGGSYTMYMDKLSDRTAWFQMIETQQAKLIERDRRFELIPIATSFPASVKINCSAVFDRGRCVVLGTDQGVYVGIAHKPRSFQLLKTLKHDRIHQIEVIERHNCLLLLADKERTLYSYPLDVLAIARAGDQNTFKPKKLQRNVSFFRYGVCMNSDMLCSVKSKNIPQATTIKVYHPMSMYEVPSRKGFGGLLRNRESISGDIWRSFRDCYIGAEATSLHFLKSKLCIGCNRGFEVIDLATLNPQTLLDPVDESLQFVLKRDNVRPISFFRVQEGEYLLCYDEFAFYVNRNGQRARPNWIIHWEGEPTA
ncbi:RHO1 GDP-GTP exchange protein 2, partial [Spiromyces aspiralis]